MNKLQKHLRWLRDWLKARDTIDVFNVLIPCVVILTAIVYMLR